MREGVGLGGGFLFLKYFVLWIERSRAGVEDRWDGIGMGGIAMGFLPIRMF